MSGNFTSMQDRVCLITGGSRGIGRAAALKLAQQGAHVILVSKDQTRAELVRAAIVEETGNHNVAAFTADLSVIEETHQLAGAIKAQYPTLDVLINNHTLILERRETSRDGIEMNFALNHLAYFHLTLLLLDLIKRSPAARIVNVSAELHRRVRFNFDDPFFEAHYDGIDAYLQAKLGNILFTYELARRLAGTPISVNALHPGSTDTDARRTVRAMYIARDNLNPAELPIGNTLEESAERLVYLATSPEVEGITGKYFVDCKQTESSPESYDEDAAARLWKMSAAIAGTG
jgi:NAD(P)-dependent dehydrogenase (short-subunit alcohol dehydrogenase family)